LERGPLEKVEQESGLNPPKLVGLYSPRLKFKTVRKNRETKKYDWKKKEVADDRMGEIIMWVGG